MGYLSCKADSSIATCRSLSAVAHAGGTFSSLASPYHRHRRRKDCPTRNGAGTNTDVDAKGAVSQGLRQFSYKVLEEATGNFSDESLLGRGSHGSVYKAILASGRVVAVKRPSRARPRQPRVPSTPARVGGVGAGGESTSTTTVTNSTDSSCRVLGRSEIQNEMEVLSRIQGCPRMVNLVGVSCGGSLDSGNSSGSGAAAAGLSSFQKPDDRAVNLLVMEYMPNGTLFDLLHSNPRPPGWSRRLRLALQTAKAVHALHSHSPPVIHRDVKSANVLLDQGLNARLGDFGLAVFCHQNEDEPQLPQQSLFFSPSSSFRSTPPAGTLGYLDPSYVTPDSLSTKTDVFSFGILLLEIMSGRKAFDVAHSPPSIVEWAIPLMRRGKVLSLFDPRIAPPVDPFARRQLAALAASCVRSSRDRRPSMDQVIERLKPLSKAISSKVMAWNGFYVANPCSAIDTQSTHHSKLKNRPSSHRFAKEDSCEAATSSRDTSPRAGVEVEVEFEVEEDKSVDTAIAVPLPLLVPFQNSRIPRRVPSSSSSRCHRNLVDLIKSTSLEEETVTVRTPSNMKLARSYISQIRAVKPMKQTSVHHAKDNPTTADLPVKSTVEGVTTTNNKVEGPPSETTTEVKGMLEDVPVVDKKVEGPLSETPSGAQAVKPP